jgi:hypothetical protein
MGPDSAAAIVGAETAPAKALVFALRISIARPFENAKILRQNH